MKSGFNSAASTALPPPSLPLVLLVVVVLLLLLPPPPPLLLLLLPLQLLRAVVQCAGARPTWCVCSVVMDRNARRMSTPSVQPVVVLVRA